MSWFEKLIPSKPSRDDSKESTVPHGLWEKCNACGSVLYRSELERNQDVCHNCGHHFRIAARTRLTRFFDHETAEELDADLEPIDKLKFKDSKKYKDRLSQYAKNTGEKDALIVMKGEVMCLPLVAAAFEFRFMGGSMGAVVGEKFVRAVAHCIKQSTPLVCFSASGGARMQEALFSLMQMSKTSAALSRLAQHGLPYISVLTDPTMGGVSASFAMLGDIQLAEPGAEIGFAGRRVIEQTVRENLPEGFQRAEFLLEHGAIDKVVDRREMRNCIANLLTMLQGHPAPTPLSATATR